MTNIEASGESGKRGKKRHQGKKARGKFLVDKEQTSKRWLKSRRRIRTHVLRK